MEWTTIPFEEAIDSDNFRNFCTRKSCKAIKIGVRNLENVYGALLTWMDTE